MNRFDNLKPLLIPVNSRVVLPMECTYIGLSWGFIDTCLIDQFNEYTIHEMWKHWIVLNLD